MNEHFIKQLLSSIRCSVCGDRYQAKDLKILGHQDDTWFVNACCPACYKRAFVVAIIKRDKPPQIIKELSEIETAKFAQASAINSDDILDLHDFLKDFDGDFITLFSNTKSES